MTLTQLEHVFDRADLAQRDIELKDDLTRLARRLVVAVRTQVDDRCGTFQSHADGKDFPVQCTNAVIRKRSRITRRKTLQNFSFTLRDMEYARQLGLFPADVED